MKLFDLTRFSALTAIVASLLTGHILAEPAATAESIEDLPPSDVQTFGNASVAAESKPLTATFRGTGRYESAVLEEIKFAPKAYTGKLVVDDAVEPGTRVSAGEVILRLEAEDMTDQLDDARFALQQAEQQMRWAQAERQALIVEHEIAKEKSELALADAEQDWSIWQEVTKADSYLDAELGMAERRARIEDQREELKQLEALYKGAKLASQTQDIVLERARRSLKIDEQQLGIMERAYERQINITLPRQERDLKNALGWQRVQSEIAAARWRTTLQRQDAAIATAERSLRSAKEKLEQLELDRESLSIKAGKAGIVTGLDLEPGDNAAANQALGKLIGLAPKTVTLSVPAADLRLMNVGDKVQVRSEAFGELVSTGRITAIDYTGKAEQGGAAFGVHVELEEVDPMIRPNMAAIVSGEKKLNAAVVVPRSAVKKDENGKYVMVVTDDGTRRRDVMLGAGNADQVQIVHGLEAGEKVMP